MNSMVSIKRLFNQNIACYTGKSSPRVYKQTQNQPVEASILIRTLALDRTRISKNNSWGLPDRHVVSFRPPTGYRADTCKDNPAAIKDAYLGRCLG